MRVFIFLGILALMMGIYAHPTSPSEDHLESPGSSAPFPLGYFPPPSIKIPKYKKGLVRPVSHYVPYHKMTDAEKAGFEKNKAQHNQKEYVHTAISFVNSVEPNATYILLQDHYIGSNGIAHVNFRQKSDSVTRGVDSYFNVNISPDGKIFSYHNGFQKESSSVGLASRSNLDPVAALEAAVFAFDAPVKLHNPRAKPKINERESRHYYTITGTEGAHTDPEVELVGFPMGDGTFSDAWEVFIDVKYDAWTIYIDAKNNRDVLRWMSHKNTLDSFKVYPWGVRDPKSGRRKMIKNPSDNKASPFTWVSNEHNSTIGNNAHAQVDSAGNNADVYGARPWAREKHRFVYSYSPTMESPMSYSAASVTQLFYTVNKYHDLLYTLGFTEEAGNFQKDNNGKGGLENDPVILDAQDSSVPNNAGFFSFPDGMSPRLEMGLYTKSWPIRDSSFDAGVVIHEYTHGMSNRLTGGPLTHRCLDTAEAGGMNEGWSDFMPTAILLKPRDKRSTDKFMGAWLKDDPKGIRKYPYSTDMKRNNLTYKSLDSMNEYDVHSAGTYWATVLFEMMWNLIDKHGKNDRQTPFLDSRGAPTDGRFLAMKLVMDAMALQPCNPNMIQARDSILDADTALTGGTNHCEIWRAFAKRGLGTKATFKETDRKDNHDVPYGDDCKRRYKSPKVPWKIDDRHKVILRFRGAPWS